MKIDTNLFGEIEFSEDALIYFPKGAIGFEDCRRFVIVDKEEYKPFRGLVSVDDRKATLPVLNPFTINADFGKELPSELLQRLFSSAEMLDIFCVVNLKNDMGTATINLKSPIIIDHHLKEGKQIILESDNLPVNQPLL